MNQSNSNKFFHRVFARTCSQLEDALGCYYPPDGDNDIAEAMTALCFGNALRVHGYFLYPEVQCQKSIREHVDLAAVRPDKKVIVLMEAKKLNKSEGARSLGRDWRRLNRIRISDPYEKLPKRSDKYLCLLGTIWNNENKREWLTSNQRGWAPKGTRNRSDWKDLRSALRKASVIRIERIKLPPKFSDQLHLFLAVIKVQGVVRRC